MPENKELQVNLNDVRFMISTSMFQLNGLENLKILDEQETKILDAVLSGISELYFSITDKEKLFNI